MRFDLPPLPYDVAALEPHIDAQTMQLHHDKHHQAYLDKLNTALEKHPELDFGSAEELLSRIEEVPEDIRTVVQNNGGGYVNHSLFWSILSPNGGGEPQGSLAHKILETFGSFDDFKTQFADAATNRFGSGWAWLVLNKAGELAVTSTANQDSPLMEGQIPLLGLDVWEHAYYLKYQNRRQEYIQAFWSMVNWDEVARHFEEHRR